MNSAGAGERVRVFEMGEGGFTIEFPMTPDEITVQDAAYDRIIAASKKSVVGSSSQVIVFEMGEAGNTVVFPMTAEEITANIPAPGVKRYPGSWKIVNPRNF